MSASSSGRVRRARAVAASIALGVACVAVRAVAQDAPPEDAAAVATRRDLIVRAEQARDAGDHATALDLATRAARLRMTPSLRLFIAQQLDASGRVTEALGNTDLCLSEAARDPTRPNLATVVETCRALGATLRTRAAHVVVVLDEPAPRDVVVRVGGARLDPALVGAPLIVDPGRVRVNVAAPGYASFARDLDVAAGASPVVRAHLDRLGENQVIRHAAPSHAPWALVGTGLGVAALSGLFFGLERLAIGPCDPDGACPDQPTVDRVLGFGVATDVALCVGSAAVVAGLVWLLVDRAAPHGAPR